MTKWYGWRHKDLCPKSIPRIKAATDMYIGIDNGYYSILTSCYSTQIGKNKHSRGAVY